MAAASKQIGSAEANVASAGLVLWQDRSSAPLWPCGAGGQPRPVVVHRRVGALVMATGEHLICNSKRDRNSATWERPELCAS
jgi:hypothetical protein